MFRIFPLGLFALGLVLAFPAAQAQTLSRSVPTRDLDLATHHGVRTLQHRVSAAAGRICRVSVSDLIYLMAAQQACRRQAIAGAQPQILSAVAQARSRADQRLVQLASR